MSYVFIRLTIGYVEPIVMAESRLLIGAIGIFVFALFKKSWRMHVIPEKKNLGINIKGLSYSFVPKHICFWSGKGERKEGLPILDDVIAKIVYKVDEAKKVDYETFINDIKQKP